MALSVILDTDIGGDVDDLLALAVLLASPEIKLRAVTCVYGDVRTRARIALKALSLRGRSEIAVAPGAEHALNAERPLLCGKDDGARWLTSTEAELRVSDIHGSDVIVETVMADPGEIQLAAIGALTNLALALLKEPRVAENVAGITIMGGVVGGAGQLDLPWVDYNFACDPEAAKIVLASGAPVRLVPLDVTMKVRIFPSDVNAIHSLGDPFHLALADQVERYPHFGLQGWTYLHDPLAVATMIREDLVTWKPVNVRVETGGEYSAGKLIAQAPSAELPENACIALAVDAQAAHDFILSRLLGQ
jgi:purine nucleosidase